MIVFRVLRWQRQVLGAEACPNGLLANADKKITHMILLDMNK
jgi:hypothetical protein